MQEGQNAAPGYNQNILADYLGLLWLPVGFALAAVIATWTVWHFTSEPCTLELAKTSGCSLSSLAKFINLDLLNKMFAHGAIAGGAGGFGSYVMLRLERQARERAERELAEERRQAAEERQQAAEERRQAAENQQRLLEMILELTRGTPNGSQEQGSSEHG